MAESTLAMTYDKLRGHVGHYLGYGWGEEFYGDIAWTTRQLRDIAPIIESGLRQFYVPRPADMNGTIYEWSFLQITDDFTLASGAMTIALPADFGGFLGRLTVTTTGAASSWGLAVGGPGQIDQAHANSPNSSGAPQFVAIRPIRGTTLQNGQREELAVFPTADRAYTLRGQYTVVPDKITPTRPHPYGGSIHSETILAACLAAAEFFKDNRKGVNDAYFQERLMASIGQDRRMKPQTYGRNRDRSDETEPYRRGSVFPTIEFDLS